MKAMNGLTHQEIVTLKHRLESEAAQVRRGMHKQFANAASAETVDTILPERAPPYREKSDDGAAVDALSDERVSSFARAGSALRAIQESLDAIEAGTYGSCQDCNRHIGIRRLKANPSAVRCNPCQARAERGRAHASPHAAV
ncbi:MAG: TraR/DksA family transcriptional regulator [Rhodocyclaceae bacterium]|nr:TraR/DksA family transcriptional regulator [Rhodocyclaceae bacterium]